MNQHTDMFENLKNDVSVPDKISKRVDDTLAFLPPEGKKAGQRRKPPKYRHTALKTLSAAAAVVLIFTVTCIANPAFASRLPFIGGIFAQLQDHTVYQGNFDAKAQTLVELPEQEEGSTGLPTKDIPAEYSARDQGITITASQVYSDGIAVYLTAQVQYETDVGLTRIPQHYTSYTTEQETTTAQTLYVRGDWSTGGQPEQWLDNANLEGNAVDDRTFVGMMVVPLNEYTEEDGVLELKLDNFGYDRTDDPNDPDQIANWDNFTDGSWTLSVPYTVDTSMTKVVPVDEYRADGSGLESVIVTAHQVVVQMKANYHLREDNADTRAEYDTLYGEGNEKGVPVGEYSYEEFLAEKLYDSGGLLVYAYDKNGITLPPMGGTNLKQTFSVQGLDISELHLFAGTDFEGMHSAQTPEEARAAADLDVHLDLK